MELFTQATAQWGLGVGLLIVACVGLTRFVLRILHEREAAHEREKAEIRTERDLYRDRWLAAIDRLEVADEAAKRLAVKRRKSGGS